MTAGFVTIVALGVLFIAIAMPMILRRVPPNSAYGLRVPSTFADESVWYEANARHGRDLVVLGVLTVILGIGFPVLQVVPLTLALPLCFAFFLVGAVVVAVVGWRRANRLLDERRRGK